MKLFIAHTKSILINKFRVFDPYSNVKLGKNNNIHSNFKPSLLSTCTHLIDLISYHVLLDSRKVSLGGGFALGRPIFSIGRFSASRIT